MKRAVSRIGFATVWIIFSEFVRNQLLFVAYWRDHYTSLGISFPETPIHGAVWGLWSLTFAIVIYVISQKFSFKETAVLGWIFGFVMMWLVIGNLGVLPYGLLWFAIPLSILEVVVATFIVTRPQSK